MATPLTPLQKPAPNALPVHKPKAKNPLFSSAVRDFGPLLHSLFWSSPDARQAWWEVCPKGDAARLNPTLDTRKGRVQQTRPKKKRVVIVVGCCEGGGVPHARGGEPTLVDR